MTSASHEHEVLRDTLVFDFLLAVEKKQNNSSLINKGLNISIYANIVLEGQGYYSLVTFGSNCSGCSSTIWL